MYFAILLAAAFAILKYGLPMVTPFVTAFVIAYLLKGPICFLSGRLHLNQKVTAILLVLLFYSTAGLLIALLCIKMFSQGKALIVNLPAIYTNRAEPVLEGYSAALSSPFCAWTHPLWVLWRNWRDILYSRQARWFPGFP